MKVICNSAFPTSLQFMCCQMLRKCIPQHLDVLKVVSLPPGLRDFLENNVRWLLQPCPPQGVPKDKNRKRTYENSSLEKDDEPGPSKRLRSSSSRIDMSDKYWKAATLTDVCYCVILYYQHLQQTEKIYCNLKTFSSLCHEDTRIGVL